MSIPKELILDWQRSYGEVYSLSVRSIDYAFRSITYAEYDEVLRLAKYVSSAAQEDYLVETALLYPKLDLDQIAPGIVSKLAEAVLDNSGFGKPHKAIELLAAQRAKIKGVRVTIYSLILDAMRSYRKEDLDKRTFAQLIELAILAEEIIKIRQAYADPNAEVSFEIIDVEAQRKVNEEKDRRKREALRRSAEKNGTDPDDIRYNVGTIKPGDPIAERLKSALGH